MKAKFSIIEALVIVNSGWTTKTEHELFKIAQKQLKERAKIIYLKQEKALLKVLLDKLRKETKI